jgi:hypothetical protein
MSRAPSIFLCVVVFTTASCSDTEKNAQPAVAAAREASIDGPAIETVDDEAQNVESGRRIVPFIEPKKLSSPQETVSAATRGLAAPTTPSEKPESLDPPME